MKKKILICCAIGVVCLTATDASSKVFPWSGEDWTVWSGFTASNCDTTEASPGYALTGFTWQEKGDDPVRLWVWSRKLCNGSCTGEEGSKIETTSANAMSSIKGASVAAGHYLTALQVCTTEKNDSANDKIKGIRVWGARLKGSGKLISDPQYSEDSRTQCKKWRTKVQCAPGEVATGARDYFSHKTGFTGLRLRCSTVVVPVDEPPEFKPYKGPIKPFKNK